MTTDRTPGEQIGRRLGERIGRVLGKKTGRVVGEWFGKKLTRENHTDDGGDAADSERDEAVSDAAESTDSDVPQLETRDELEEMSYRELQSLAKDIGVKANITKEEMIERLSDTLNVNAEEQ